MSVRKNLQEQFQAIAQETVMKLMQDDRTRPMVAKAMQAYLEGRQRVDDVRDQTAQNLGLTTQSETQKLSGRLRKLERQLEKLQQKIEQAETSLAAIG